MSTTNEQLSQRAHELALQQHIKVTAGHPGYIKKQFDADIAGIRAFVADLQDDSVACGQQAEEWLLDNAEFIEEQALDVKLHLGKAALVHLPRLRGEGRLRVHALCLAFLDLVDGILDEGTLRTFLSAYQEISVLTLAETRSIPIMLKVSLIGKIAEAMVLVRDRREVCSQVQRLLKRIDPAKMSTDAIGAALDEAGQSEPLSGPWAAHLISHLREWTGDSAVVREWLACKYENGSEDLDRIVTYEAKLQAAYQMKAGNLITSLRSNERRDWAELFKEISMLDRTMREDATGIYARLDEASRHEILNRVETLARRMRVPESLVASQSLALALQASETGTLHAGTTDSRDTGEAHPPAELPRQAFAAYYVFEPAGVTRLVQALKLCSQPRNMPAERLAGRAPMNYFISLTGLFALLLIALAAWVVDWNVISSAGMAAVLLALLFPVSEWVMTFLHFGIDRICRTKPLLRYDYSSGIEQGAATMVVIPAIWSTVQEVEELADRLEIHYLGNRDPNIHYALLGDFTDAKEERLPSDELLIAAGKARIDRLNRMYGGESGTTFHYYQRTRQWNPGEGAFMGWERKRGKLVEFVELLRGSGDTSYEVMHGDREVLPGIKYLITLDADTQLPLGSAQRLIGTLHLPYNRPRLNKEGTRVVEGYGVLQPRIGTSHESAMRSRLAYFWSDPGIDPYAFTVSDPYQDALGAGIFTGKGIFDVNVFAQLLGERIPDNTVLSHDLLEGGFMRAALVSDIELIEEHPSTFLSFQKRMHRWVRGDWQLLCWLRAKLCDRRGVLQPIDLSLLTRWQIVDNLRRSLLPIALFVLFALAVTVLPGYPARWLTLLFATLLLPLIRQLVGMNPADAQPKRLISTFVLAVIGFWTLPFQAAVLLNAIVKTVYRVAFSKRRMLEWTSFSQTERSQSMARRSTILGAGGGYALIVLFAAAAVLQPIAGLLWFGLALCLFWALAPLAVRWLDQPVFEADRPLEAADAEQLRGLAKEIWQFYEDFAGKEDHFLPPDNVQIEPSNGVAHRTSPTNIGFLLTAAVAARELDFITTPVLVERLERTVGVIERMEKWNGHLYNWYDTTTLGLLHPAYVSTVDSGNFVASLMTVKQGLLRWLQEDGWVKGARRTPGYAAAAGTEFAVELDQIRPEDLYETRQEALHQDMADLPSGINAWLGRGYELVERLERLIVSTDFRQLYDDKAKLFVLGYHADSGRRDTILYDLLASEARQTSFVAIALGQISVAHWFAIGRTSKKQGSHTALISWSGTMFEYMMPWLIMRTYPGTVWDSTYRGVVQRQIEYAKERGVPFGISESGYYAFDYQLNYQYRAFGVPGLGFKRGLEEDLVVAPYAAIMALPFALREGLDNLARLDQIGARGQYGYYEAIDFSAGRMPQDESCKVIRSFMAHHQGMSLLTLANMLVPSCMIDYFHADKRIRAAELLLIERIPPKSAILNRELPGRTRRAGDPKPAHNAPLREFETVPAPMPEANVHGNGSLTTVLTETGSGFIRYNGLDLTRWREDPVTDPWGSFMYIRDVAKNACWSPSYQPCRKDADRQSVQFLQERTTFQRADDGLLTKLEVTVSAEHNAEIRRLTLTNTTQEARIVEVTTYMELAMAAHDADKAHPAFTKLFVQTEFDSESQCLLARKRPRNEGEPSLWAFHAFGDGDGARDGVEFETDRAAFIGRGNTLAKPRGLDARLGGAVGSVADPAFIMRRRVHVEPGKQVSLTAVTGAADSKEQALEIAAQLSTAGQAERSFQLAWTRSQIDLQHLRIADADAAAYQLLAGRILFASPLRPEQEASIAANAKGQPGLWAHGVSGDRPIALARIEDTSSLPFMNKLLVGYEYLRRKGLFFDLVIWNESSGGYQQELRDELQRMIGQYVQTQGSGAGVHIVAASAQPDEDKHLLFAAARLLLHADGPSLRAQLLPREPAHAGQAAELAPIAPPNRYSEQPARDESGGLFFNGYGGFSPDGGEYRIVLQGGQQPPAPWINVVANANFGFLASELYTGHTWWRNSRECKLTPWSNDPALDPPGEAVYVRDELSGEYWGMVPSRKKESTGVYTVAHGQGYSRYEHDSHGLHHEMTAFVPPEDPVKIIRLRLANGTNDTRKLSVTYYAEWVIGVHREGNASSIVTEWDAERRILLARNTYQDTFRDATPFLALRPRTPGTSESWTGSRLSFIGRDGDLEDPAAMRRARLSGETGPVHDACGAVQVSVSLEPGEDGVVYILLGCGDSRESAARLAGKYGEADACEQALRDMRALWKDVNGTIRVATPSAEMDIMLNNWLLYQSLSCRMWARTAFYQAGGAFGFRDQLQDSLAMLHIRPDMTREQIIRHASHQYLEGDVQHWWHEETHRGIRTRFSDDLLWLPYAVVRYLEHTEDESILSELAPFLQSEQLKEGEHERYEETVQSQESGTILEHCFRALDRALRFGEHGLPLMGIGDWNDGMSNIGPEGRGESVWLGWFLGDVLRGIAGICERRGDRDHSERYMNARRELESAMQEAAWDGNWYRRAFTDAGDWLGSVRNAECRIDAIAQSWSVISGMAPPERAQQAMRSFDRELVDRHLAVAHILTPPFDKTKPSPGYIQAYPPGIRENGGQYTHGVIWSIVAWSMLGDGNKAFELFHMFNPITHTKSAFEARTYVGEPYAMTADVYTEPPHRGHAGWTWYTGAAGWMYQAGIEWILGLKRRGNRLLINPCIPAEWPEFSVTYTYGRTAYRINVYNPSRRSGGCTALRIDGEEAEISAHWMDDSPFIAMEDDQKEHVIELTL
ncbi:GH36-type glycosyl hydrolase domain-containing protein [Paenibacillus sacheonensis]|uniref:Glycosyl transferase family 36 n=1 Tax=Paenibacillus sacheonensis TaxID=742054 RepID=A0A7X4YQ68_9BACL|nr:glucoamylase family protein [Paenibacillus sacheonensis]MBM7566291.1 cellobiose phosphorylase/predicted transcriptional regulator [Paenibacillus sacheonensis]NBC70497.1 glycosyl transferase family 36 [Paenibacillus sacheonensis]